MIPKALHDQFLSQKALIILASSVSPISPKLPPALRSLRSTSPSLEYSHPYPMANWFLLSPEASVFCYFSRGGLSTHIINQQDRFGVEFVLTTPKSFYRIHTKIGSCLIFFFFLLSPCILLALWWLTFCVLHMPLCPRKKAQYSTKHGSQKIFFQ